MISENTLKFDLISFHKIRHQLHCVLETTMYDMMAFTCTVNRSRI